MNKKLLAIAVAAFVAAPAIATAQTTLSGQFKYEVGFIDDGNDSNLVHSSRGTRLSLKGSEDLGGGLKGVFNFSGNFDQVNTKLGSENYNLNEDNFVGLGGGFGTVYLGRKNTALKIASSPFRAFSDSLADINNRPAGWQRAEGVHYTSPNFGGVNVNLTVEPNGIETDAYYALSAIYKAGPLYVSAAFESAAEDAVYAVGDIDPDTSNWQVGAKYTFGPADVGALYQARNDSDDTVITIPVNFKVTPNVNLRAAVQYIDIDESGDDFTNYAIGAQYNFSKRTEAYVNIWADDFVGPTPGGADDTHFGVGVRHSF